MQEPSRLHEKGALESRHLATRAFGPGKSLEAAEKKGVELVRDVDELGEIEIQAEEREDVDEEKNEISEHSVQKLVSRRADEQSEHLCHNQKEHETERRGSPRRLRIRSLRRYGHVAPAGEDEERHGRRQSFDLHDCPRSANAGDTSDRARGNTCAFAGRYQRDHRDKSDQLDEKAHCVFLHQGLLPGRSPDDADAALHGDGEESRRPRQAHQADCGCQKAQPVAEVGTRSDGAAEWSEKSCDQPVDLRDDPGIAAKERRGQAEGEEYRRCHGEQKSIGAGGSMICKLVFPYRSAAKSIRWIMDWRRGAFMVPV